MTALNQKMNMLSAIGIILVVAGHCGISFIRQFPVYSFHMPLFIFISGYFFQARPFPEFFRKKFVRLILPLALWSMFYTYFINGLHDMGLAGWHYSSDLSTILWRSLVQGWNPQFNVPAWFLSTLFWTQLLYWGIYKVTKKNLLLTGGGKRGSVRPVSLPA